MNIATTNDVNVSDFSWLHDLRRLAPLIFAFEEEVWI